MTKHFPTIFAIAVAALTLIHVSNAEEESSQGCRLKYSGEMYIEGDYSQAIGVSTKSKALTRSFEHASMKAEMFMFYECKIDGYYSYPEEYGFLIAQSSSTEFCATAYQDGDDQQNEVSYSICHRHCDYAATNMEVVNRQLVKATYIFEESFGGRVQMTFQGSPNSQTNTGFDQQYAHVQPSKHRHSTVHPKTQVVKISNDSHGSKMALRNVTVHPHDCINPGKRTSNEEMIMQYFKMDGDMHFGYDAMEYFSNYGTIF